MNGVVTREAGRVHRPADNLERDNMKTKAKTEAKATINPKIVLFSLIYRTNLGNICLPEISHETEGDMIYVKFSQLDLSKSAIEVIDVLICAASMLHKAAAAIKCPKHVKIGPGGAFGIQVKL